MQHLSLHWSFACSNTCLSTSLARMNLTKNLIGAGIFSLPSGLKSGSVIPGLTAMVTASWQHIGPIN